MPDVHDVIITGRGPLALFAARRALLAGRMPLVVGTGRPFERFLLLHENALRVLERAYGAVPGHALQGVRVLDAALAEIGRLRFREAGLRLHAMRHSALMAWLEARHAAPLLKARIRQLDPAGRVILEDGRVLAARRVVNTAAALAPRPALRVRHRKVFRMGFIDHVPDADWVVQINDAGTYAIVIPFGDDAAVVSAGDMAPLRRLLGGNAPVDAAFTALELETWCGWRWRQGRIVHVGEAARRVHPHTAQGLNRALDAVDAFFAGRASWRERMHDCVVWAGGLLLDAIWGGPSPSLIRASLRLLSTRAGLRLASGTLLQRGLLQTKRPSGPSGHSDQSGRGHG